MRNQSVTTKSMKCKGRQEEKKQNKKKCNKTDKKTINKTAIVSPFLQLINFNVNGLNCSIKRHTVAEWILKTKQDPTRTHIS